MKRNTDRISDIIGNIYAYAICESCGRVVVKTKGGSICEGAGSGGGTKEFENIKEFLSYYALGPGEFSSAYRNVMVALKRLTGIDFGIGDIEMKDGGAEDGDVSGGRSKAYDRIFSKLVGNRESIERIFSCIGDSKVEMDDGAVEKTDKAIRWSRKALRESSADFTEMKGFLEKAYAGDASDVDRSVGSYVEGMKAICAQLVQICDRIETALGK